MGALQHPAEDLLGRIFDPYFQRSLAGPLITVLLGPGQTGKTTTVNSFLGG